MAPAQPSCIRSRTAALVATAVALLLSHCPCAPPLVATCQVSSQCSAGAACVAGQCQIRCADDAVCPDGQRCHHGLCAGVAVTCATGDECPATAACVDGRCRDLCVLSRECQAGESCRAGHCWADDAGAPDRGLVDGSGFDRSARDGAAGDSFLPDGITVAVDGSPADTALRDSTVVAVDGAAADGAGLDASGTDRWDAARVDVGPLLEDSALPDVTLPCGDGYLASGEDCDDGNTQVGDGCDSGCKQEAGFVCVGAGPGSCTACTVPLWTDLGGGNHCGGDWTPADGSTIAGVHLRVGTFRIASPATVHVQPYDGVSYGTVEIHAVDVVVEAGGRLSADGAGFGGGGGGGGSSGRIDGYCNQTSCIVGTGGAAGRGVAGGAAGTAGHCSDSMGPICNGTRGASGGVGGGPAGGGGGLYGEVSGGNTLPGGAGQPGGAGGYLAPGVNGDSGEGDAVRMGSGGGGGGSGSGASGSRYCDNSSGGGGGGAGARGGGAIVLVARDTLLLAGEVSARGLSSAEGGVAGSTVVAPSSLSNKDRSGNGGRGGNADVAGDRSGGAGGNGQGGTGSGHCNSFDCIGAISYGMGPWCRRAGGSGGAGGTGAGGGILLRAALLQLVGRVDNLGGGASAVNCGTAKLRGCTVELAGTVASGSTSMVAGECAPP